MKKYRVNVDGEEFEVTVEELGSQKEVKTSVTKTENKSSTPAKAQKTETTNSKSISKPEDTEGEKIVAALPGTITSIEIAEGDQVEKGDVLFIHEAMKMENEITTPVSGIVKSILITEGTDVDTDDVLAIVG